jgi:hypothetical protein
MIAPRAHSVGPTLEPQPAAGKAFFVAAPAAAWFFAAGLVAIPFDAVRGLGALGELGNEASFYFFAPAIALAAFAALRSGLLDAIRGSLALRIGLCIMAVIAVSALANAADIVSLNVRERSALGKFVTSLMVIGYGITLAWLAERLRGEDVPTLVARFVCWGAILALIYLPIEWAGKHGLLGGLFDAVDGLVHSRQADVINAWDGSVNERVAYGWDPRLRSVSFEPPAFGNYTGFAWPWLAYAAAIAPRGKRLAPAILLGAFTAAIVLTGSRTGLVMLASNIGVGIGLFALYANGRFTGEAAAAVRVLVPLMLLCALGVAAALVIADAGAIVGRMVTGDSVSNITRAGFQFAGFQMALDHPLLGTGLGQYGIHVAQYLPAWIFISPEVRPMLVFPEAPWPAAYSIYARIGAELGFVGLAGWLMLWLGMALRLAGRARTASEQGAPRITAHYPVIMNCVGVLASGIASDTFRTPLFWIALGLGCEILRREPVARVSRAPGPARSPLPRRLPQ